MATNADAVTSSEPDDLSGSYESRRELLAQTSAGDELLEWALRRESMDQRLQASARAAEGEPEGSIAERAGAAAKDLGLGALELPRAGLAGVRDAVQNTVDLAGDIGQWFEEKLRLPGIQISGAGIELVSADELAALRAEGKDLASKISLPEVEDPKSTTGKMAKGIIQFIAGFAGAGKVKGLTGATTTFGRSVQAAGRGALADIAVWDPHEQRLSDLVQRFPKLRNPITEYLSADKDDSALEGRFKNALEGLGLGMLTDGLMLGLKQLRNVRLQRLQNAGRTVAVDDSLVRPLDPKAFDALGSVDAPAVTTAGTPGAAKVRRALSSTDAASPDQALTAAEGDVFINFRRIDTPEDVRNTLQKVADAYKPDIDAARRGKRSFKEIELSAEQEDAWQTLMARRTGEPLNAEQSVAARKLWVSSSEKLTELARLAADTPSEANLFAFRKMMATHYAIQSEVIAARTETARALASWRIPVGGGKEMTRALEYVLAESGGAELSREMAQRIARLSSAGMSKELDAFVRGSVWARSRDAMLEVWINGLLSGPKTHIVNTMSNSAVAFMQMYERATAARIGQLLGDGGVQVGEAMAQWHGLTEGLKDAMRYAWKAFKSGETGMGLGKIDLPHRAAFSSEAFGISSSGWLGRAIDTLGNNVVRLPGRFLAAEDEFFKTIGYRMELRAQALRQATQDVHSGIVPKEQLKSRIAELIENPPENLRLTAIDQAAYQTFTNAPGKIAKGMQKIAAEYPAVRIIMPFVRTPANIFRYTFERTPLAPLFKQVRADLAAGGSRRDLALARMGTGTAVMLAAADLAMNEQISGGGPASPSERQALARSGWQRYSVKLGDRWYAYNRLDPLGMTLGLAADMVEIVANTDYDAEDVDLESLTIATAAAIGNNTMSKAYLSGLSEFFEAMADPKRYSENWAQRLGGSLIPTGVAEVTRAQDPYMREVSSMMDAVRARTPGLSDELPVRRDLWGRPISHESGLGFAYDMASPIYSRKENPEPIDRELLRLESPIPMPRKKASFDGVTIDLGLHPKAYSRYVELAGNELKHPAWGLGAKDLLNAVIEGKHPLSDVYRIRSDGPDGGKDVFIRNTVRDFQERARRQLLEEFPELKEQVEERQERRRAIRWPSVG